MSQHSILLFYSINALQCPALKVYSIQSNFVQIISIVNGEGTNSEGIYQVLDNYKLITNSDAITFKSIVAEPLVT